MLKLGAVIAIVLLNSSTALAASGCHNVAGGYVQGFVPCDPPALACVDATLTGDLAGISHTVITGFDPATDTFTGVVTIVRNNGSVITSTLVNVAGSGVGTEQITGGTRQYVGATGFIIATGTFTSGTYAGQYCLAGDGNAQ